MQTLENWYTEQTTSKKLEFDNAQLSILQQLDKFIYKFRHTSFLNRLFNKPEYLGYYIYGSVGCGKSMIMNELFQIFPDTAKIRMHFHEFMNQIQYELNNLKAHDNPLDIVAKNLSKQFKIIFLDEMIVNDIATAMILNNLFKSLFDHNIFIITTSNSKPDDLYSEGLMRERFLPTVKLFNTKLKVINLDSSRDYRLLHDSSNNLFIIKEASATIILDTIFKKIAKNIPIDNDRSILIHSRQIPIIQKCSSVIWLDFKIICGDKRSQLDYLELIKKFEWFIISDITAINDKDKDIARRFTWLIDILYDNQVKLALSSNVELDNIYPTGDLINEFARTISRLKEMQTKEYINKPKLNSNLKEFKHVEQ